MAKRNIIIYPRIHRFGKYAGWLDEIPKQGTVLVLTAHSQVELARANIQLLRTQS